MGSQVKERWEVKVLPGYPAAADSQRQAQLCRRWSLELKHQLQSTQDKFLRKDLFFSLCTVGRSISLPLAFCSHKYSTKNWDDLVRRLSWVILSKILLQTEESRNFALMRSAPEGLRPRFGRISWVTSKHTYRLLLWMALAHGKAHERTLQESSSRAISFYPVKLGYHMLPAR